MDQGAFPSIDGGGGGGEGGAAAFIAASALTNTLLDSCSHLDQGAEPKGHREGEGNGGGEEVGCAADSKTLDAASAKTCSSTVAAFNTALYAHVRLDGLDGEADATDASIECFLRAYLVVIWW